MIQGLSVSHNYTPLGSQQDQGLWPKPLTTNPNQFPLFLKCSMIWKLFEQRIEVYKLYPV